MADTATIDPKLVDVETISVQCSSKDANLWLWDGGNYTCGGDNQGNKDFEKLSPGVQVDVSVDTMELHLGRAQSLENLTIAGSSTRPLVTFNNPLDATTLSKLKRLTLDSVKLGENSSELKLPNTLTELHVVNSEMEDLSLSGDTNISALTVYLTGTSFKNIPKILYERRYSPQPTFDVDLQDARATLNQTDYDNMVANVGELKACSNDSMSGGESVTVTCSASSSGSDANDASGSGSVVADAGDSSSGVSTGVLVVIIVLVVVIAAVLAFFILRMYMRRKAAKANANNNEATATLMSKGDASADKGSFISNDEFLRNFRLPQSDVALVKSMGTGRLWMGEYNGNKVVVKRVESEVTDSYVTKALMAQARTFATISHPNITSLVGVTWLAGTDFAVVTEFMDKGNLKSVLANSDVDLDITTKLQMCCDVALGLAYLHETEQNLCAKQLSTRKVLVNKAMECKLSLFECVPSSAKLGGLSGAATYSYGMGEVAWLPPEVIRRSSPMDARKNNIYAFGVLVSEIFTRVTPYQSLVENLGNTMSDVELVKRVRREEQLVPHENRQEFLAAPASVRQMVEKCLSYAPMSRPTAKDLVEILHHAKEELATNSI